MPDHTRTQSALSSLRVVAVTVQKVHTMSMSYKIETFCVHIPWVYNMDRFERCFHQEAVVLATPC